MTCPSFRPTGPFFEKTDTGTTISGTAKQKTDAGKQKRDIALQKTDT